MPGICAAVKATTRVSGSSRKTTLKSWKSRPPAPMMIDAAHHYSPQRSTSRSHSASTSRWISSSVPLAVGREQVCESLLRPQPRLDRPLLRRPVREPPLAVLDLVQRPEAALDGAVDDRGREARLVAPAERAVGEHVQEGRPVGLGGLGRLLAQVLPVRAGRRLRRRTGCRARPRSRSGPCAAAPCRATPSRPGWSSSPRRTGWRRSAGSPCSCTPRCRSRRRRTCGPARARRRAPAGRCRRCRRRRRRRRWSARRPAAARRAGGAPGRRPRRRSHRRPRSRTRGAARARSRRWSGSAWSRPRGSRSR